MIDLKLSDKGDLVLQHEKELPPLRLSCHMTEYPVLHLSFEQGYEYMHKPETGLKISFNTMNKDIKSPTSFKAVEGDDEIKQNIMMLLRTELGELNLMPGYGSELYQLKHKNLNLQTTKEAIEERICKDVMPLFGDGDVKVIAKPVKMGNNAFYCQNMAVYIFHKDKMIYSFKI